MGAAGGGPEAAPARPGAAVADRDPDVPPSGFGDLTAHGGDVTTFVAHRRDGHGTQLLYLQGGLSNGGGAGSVFRLDVLDFLDDHLR
ncbi:hypothetical protein GCM10009623_30170 [Nocardioides aestuarii]|uniref:Alpha/beta hydrolase n=1 Tax=Nocardioides aestuarii TaxID=252231 RepID=A0ABW4TP16_9ACTN